MAAAVVVLLLVGVGVAVVVRRRSRAKGAFKHVQAEAAVVQVHDVVSSQVEFEPDAAERYSKPAAPMSSFVELDLKGDAPATKK